MLAQETSAHKTVIAKFRLEIRTYLTSEKGGPKTAFQKGIKSPNKIIVKVMNCVI